MFFKKKINKCSLCKKQHDLKLIIEEKDGVYMDEKITYKYEYLICENLENNNILILDEHKIKNTINFIDTYRIKKNFLTSEEIKQIRKKYFLTCEELSKLLNWELDSIKLYETSMSQTEYRNNILIKVRDNPIFVYQCLGRNKSKLKNTVYFDLENILLKEIKYKNNYFDE